MIQRQYWSGERRTRRKTKFKAAGLSWYEIKRLQRRNNNKGTKTRLQPSAIEVQWSKDFKRDFRAQIAAGRGLKCDE